MRTHKTTKSYEMMEKAVTIPAKWRENERENNNQVLHFYEGDRGFFLINNHICNKRKNYDSTLYKGYSFELPL